MLHSHKISKRKICMGLYNACVAPGNRHRKTCKLPGANTNVPRHRMMASHAWPPCSKLLLNHITSCSRRTVR